MWFLGHQRPGTPFRTPSRERRAPGSRCGTNYEALMAIPLNPMGETIIQSALWDIQVGEINGDPPAMALLPLSFGCNTQVCLI